MHLSKWLLAHSMYVLVDMLGYPPVPMEQAPAPGHSINRGGPSVDWTMTIKLSQESPFQPSVLAYTKKVPLVGDPQQTLNLHVFYYLFT